MLHGQPSLNCFVLCQGAIKDSHKWKSGNKQALFSQSDSLDCRSICLAVNRSNIQTMNVAPRSFFVVTISRSGIEEHVMPMQMGIERLLTCLKIHFAGEIYEV